MDWSRTKVYATDKLRLNVNLKGREPKGIVEPGEAFEALLRDLTEELHGLKDVETGELVVDTVVRKEQIYMGPYVEEAPDLLFAMKGLSYVPACGGTNSRGIFGPPPLSGTHRFEGVIIMQGPRIGRWTPLHEPRIVDLAPTILYLFNLPIPREMDGRVLEEAIRPDVLAGGTVN